MYVTLSRRHDSTDATSSLGERRRDVSCIDRLFNGIVRGLGEEVGRDSDGDSAVFRWGLYDFGGD